MTRKLFHTLGKKLWELHRDEVDAEVDCFNVKYSHAIKEYANNIVNLVGLDAQKMFFPMSGCFEEDDGSVSIGFFVPVPVPVPVPVSLAEKVRNIKSPVRLHSLVEKNRTLKREKNIIWEARPGEGWNTLANASEIKKKDLCKPKVREVFLVDNVKDLQTLEKKCKP